MMVVRERNIPIKHFCRTVLGPSIVTIAAARAKLLRISKNSNQPYTGQGPAGFEAEIAFKN